MSYIPYKYSFNGKFAAMRGDTFERSFEFTNFDLAGKTFRMQVRKFAGSEPILTFDSEDDATSIEVTGDVLVLKKSAEEMADLIQGDYFYDLESDDDGVIQTIMEGKFEIKNDITR